MKRWLVRLLLAWPPRLRMTMPDDKRQSRDISGRRYGDYFWLMISLGHYHWQVFPRHVFGIWCSAYAKEGEFPPKFKAQDNSLYLIITKSLPPVWLESGSFINLDDIDMTALLHEPIYKRVVVGGGETDSSRALHVIIAKSLPVWSKKESLT